MKKLMPNSPVFAVRADTSIADCVRILRDRGIGALVVVSDDRKEEIVGMFTERDLVRQIELIQNGKAWERPVRTVMTTPVRTVDVSEIASAPKLMARYSIRHLPVVRDGRLAGVLSMRDLFRVAMEGIDYDMEKLFHPLTPAPPVHHTRTIGVISADKALTELADKGAALTAHLVLKALPQKDPAKISEHLGEFDAVLFDIDGMKREIWAKLLGRSWSRRKQTLLVVFNPLLMNNNEKAELQELARSRRFHLLSKPLALGLFYEKFLKLVG